MGDVAAALTWPLTRPLTQPGGPVYLPSTRVRRCLFGPVDHESLKLNLDENFKEVFQKDKQRWNFDFERGRPLSPGRYTWEKVGDPSDADSNGGSVTQEEEKKSIKLQQTQITDFMRKRKSSNQKDSSAQPSKTRRRSST